MKALFIGGTGTISSAAAELAMQRGAELTVLNRGSRPEPEGAEVLRADVGDEDAVRKLLSGRRFDTVADFNVFTPEQAERDIRLFSGKTDQYIFISSASAYQKPPAAYPITESTPLRNPYWEYARNKIACEEILTAAYRSNGFPATIVRPSHTYGKSGVPLAIHGKNGGWQVLERMKQGKPVIVHGDGLTLWTFTYNEDFAKGFCGLMGNPHALGQTVHITGDEAITWNDAYETIGRALGVKPNIVHIPSDFLAAFNPELLGSLLGDKAYCAVFDNSKIKRLVPGFRADIRFDEGVGRCVAYLSEHPELRVPDPEFDTWCDRVVAAHFAGMKGMENPE